LARCILTEITLPAVESICYRLRERDRIEAFNLLPYDNEYRLAWESYATMLNAGRARVAWWDGRPAALMAFTERRPGVWDAWMIGTDDFRNCAVDLVRWGRKEARDILATSLGHRLQAESRADHDEGHRLLKALGARQEGPPMKAYGKDGSDYLRFVWLKGQDDAVLEPGFVRAG
jgi:hypothetical protein